MNSLDHKFLKKDQNSIHGEIMKAHKDYGPVLSRRARYKTNNSETSQDLVQTTFLKTFLYLRKGGRIDTMRSFLNRILNDLIIDEYRKNKTTSLDVLLGKGYDPKTEDHERTVDIMDGKQVVLLTSLLPKKYREVVQMRYLQGLSLKEIAMLTKQSPNTVAVQAHRGLVKLRMLYADSDTTKKFKKKSISD